MRLVLQARDAKVLEFVFAHRVASFKQITKLFFAGIDKTVASRRLNLLCKVGLLNPCVTIVDNKIARYYAPTEKGFRIINNPWKFYIDTPHFKSESVLHDLRLVDVTTRLRALTSFVELVTENLLQSSEALLDETGYRSLAANNSDAGIVVRGRKGGEYVFGVELELNGKSLDRYKSKLTCYYMASGVEGILYICQKQSIINLLAKADEYVRGRHGSRVFCALVKDVLNSTGGIIFTGLDGQKIELL